MKILKTNNTTNKYTANQLIEEREKLIKNIKDLWYKITANNVIQKGTKQNFDLKEIYKKIRATEAELIRIKLYIQAVNMGLESLAAMPKESLYQQIFLLSQLKEHKVKLEKIQTRRKENETVVLTEKFIKKTIEEIEKMIQSVQNQVNDYNKKTIFQV